MGQRHRHGTPRAHLRRGAGHAATATATLAGGFTVGLNFVSESDQLINAQVQESQTVEDNNPFDWPQFTHGGIPGHGTAEAWRLLEANGRAGHPVTIGIIDGGFAEDNGDYPADIAGNTGLSNPLGCGENECPWHGTDVTVAAAGVMDNGFGSVGSVGPVPVTVRQYTHPGGVDSMMTQLHRAVTDGADIINMSFGGRIDAAASVFDGPPDLSTLYIHLHRDVVLVASAGNQGLDVDRTECLLVCWERQTHWPCEMDGVYCVGGLALGSRDRDPGSNYGRQACDNPVCGVKMFAPFTVLVGENPDHRGDQLRHINGTSFSAPYIAGVFALLRAANPALRSYVGRVVNSYRAVLSALGPDARILIGADRTPSPFPQDPVPAAGFSSALGSDQGTFQGDGTSPAATPAVAWVADLPDTDYPTLGWDAPVISGDVLVLPIRDDNVERQAGEDISLVGIDLRTGERRWQVDHVNRSCKPTVGRDGTEWAVRGLDVSSTLEWSFAVLSINPDTGRVTNRFTTPRAADGRYPAETDPLRDCAAHPLRLSPDGTRLLVWQGTFYTGYSSLRLLDITEPDVIETANIRADTTVDGGLVSRNARDAAWVADIRVAADRPTVYLLERDGGENPDDLGYDDAWWLHAIDLADLPRRSALTDPGIIGRSIRLPVAGIDVQRWMVLDDDIIVSGTEQFAGQQRIPDEGEGVAGRTFRVVDDGAALTQAAYQIGRERADLAPGGHEGPLFVLSAGDGQTLLAHTSDGSIIGIDRATLDQRWMMERGSWSDLRYGLVLDAQGNGLFPAPFGSAMASVTPAGGLRWQMPVRGDQAVGRSSRG